MSIGGRDFIGAASFLSGVARKNLGDGANGGGGPDSGVTPEAVLELIEKLNTAPLALLAESFGETPDVIRPHLEKLAELRFVERMGEDDEARYCLTELGHRARKYSQIAQSGS